MENMYLEKFDCVEDLVLSRHSKISPLESVIRDLKTKSGSPTLNGTLDKDFNRFLTGIGEYCGWLLSAKKASENGDKSDGEDDVDPDYKLFLGMVKEDGKSYGISVVRDGIPTFLKYESDGDSDNKHKPSTMRKSRKVPVSEKVESAKGLANSLRKDKMENKRNQRYVVNKGMTDYVKIRANGIAKERTPGNHLFEADYDCEYESFLGDLVIEGEYLVRVNKDGKRLKYEEAQSSDSEVFVANNASDLSRGNHHPYEISKFNPYIKEDEHKQPHHKIPDTPSEFREKLMGKLIEPYDEKEYEKLWQMINERTLKDERHRDLRGSAALKSYPRGEPNPSYLEHHNVLRKKIDAVKSDRSKVLNLLRGFFFWLENLVYEDSFYPWLDPLCLEVIPKRKIC